jgi:hypothetical protein
VAALAKRFTSRADGVTELRPALARGVLVTHSSIRNFGPAFFAITHSEFPG